jgi:hypothetical protein
METELVTKDQKGSSPEYIVLDEDDNEIKLIDTPVNKKRKLNNDDDGVNDNREYSIYDIKNLPTLLPLSEIKIERSVKKDLNIEKFLSEWREQNVDELLLTDDYIYKDPLINKMTPHESYAYVLGLNLVLENVTSSYKNSLSWLSNKQKKLAEGTTTTTTTSVESTKTMFNLNLGIQNEKEFLENLDDNTIKIKNLNKTLIKTQSLKYSCKICDFKTDNLHILDQHLTHPHNLNTKALVTYRDTFTTLKCNFCENFKTYLKDEYVKHLLTIHKRIFIYIKPTCAYMCNFCDYECREKLRFFKHLQQCVYNNQNFISNVQKPSLDDDFDYEFLFPNTCLLIKKYV